MDFRTVVLYLFWASAPQSIILVPHHSPSNEMEANFIPWMLMINVYNYPLEMQKYPLFRMINYFLEVLKVPPPLRNIALEKDDNYTIIVYLQG